MDTRYNPQSPYPATECNTETSISPTGLIDEDSFLAKDIAKSADQNPIKEPTLG